MASGEFTGRRAAGRSALNPLPSGQKRRALIAPTLAPAPAAYSVTWMNDLVRQLQGALNELMGPPAGIPPMSANLPVGTIYYDTQTGAVKIVTSAAPPS